ncbi:MAG: pyridoxal-phosphate dependent enzyme [Candidatus Heimdallarchaeota archaeon]|nr:pyridoxal-phosphate dependent enzyme [Candidatus Heimdallarchaeota archaeon]
MWKQQPLCTECHKEQESSLRCSKCNNLVFVPTIQGPHSSKINLDTMWSLSEFLPSFTKPISLFEGNTPVIKVENIPKYGNLSLKLEFRNPTGSFRDRALSLVVSDAIQKKKKTIVGASTGSFGISLAAYSAKANLETINVVPQNLELSKIEQMKIFGSKVIEIGDTYYDAKLKAQELASKSDHYLATPDVNILTIEGQKTISLELVLQLKNITAIIVPRGAGSLIFSIFKGFLDAQESGWIEKIPEIYAVSLEKSKVSHLAESLNIEKPFLLEEVKEILHKTKGSEIEIKADEMITAAMLLAKKEGLFIEPASASVLVAAEQLLDKNKISASSSVAILSGSGFNALNIYAAQMRGKKKVVWGLSENSTTKFEILNLIAAAKAVYGYSIWVSLGKVQSLQSIYQHLNELEARGIIISSKTAKRKEFELTTKGYETLEKMRNLIDFI